LVDLVDDERMNLGEAIAALAERERKAVPLRPRKT
jgi:hypothetical protein